MHTYIATYIAGYLSCRAHNLKIHGTQYKSDHTDQLYCHGVLHLKHQGSHAYLIEKENWVNPAIY